VINLENKGWCVFGPRGSGKSWLLESVLDSVENHIVYDPMGDHRGYRQYIPRDRSSVQELSDLVRHVIIPTRTTLFCIDEANKYIIPRKRLPPGIDDLLDFNRHFQISFGCVSRRPVQFHADLVELSDVLFIFGLHGKNDYQYLEDLHRGLGDAVRSLPKYHFVSYSQGDIICHAPIAPPGRGKLAATVTVPGRED